jgi:hypothetical protein
MCWTNIYGIGTQGIGTVQKHTGDVISFNNISDTINEGDTLFARRRH